MRTIDDLTESTTDKEDMDEETKKKKGQLKLRKGKEANKKNRKRALERYGFEKDEIGKD